MSSLLLGPNQANIASGLLTQNEKERELNVKMMANGDHLWSCQKLCRANWKINVATCSSNMFLLSNLRDSKLFCERCTLALPLPSISYCRDKILNHTNEGIEIH